MKKQANILQLLHENGTMKKSEIVAKCGFYYHCNDAFHIGNILGRMVKNGTIERVKKGVYRAKKIVRKQQQFTDLPTYSLFEVNQ